MGRRAASHSKRNDKNGPYKVAYEEFKENGLEADKFAKYFKNYMGLFFQAVELTSIYWKIVFELYDPQGNVLQISDSMRERFKEIVQNADLSSPLQKDILEKAKQALQEKPQEKFSSLISSIKSPINKEAILAVNTADIGKFC